MSESVNDVCDYVIDKVTDSGESLSNLKLQKLVYYVQAWYLAFENSSLCDEKFEAWVHGPVSRALFNRFASDKSLYSDIYRSDMRDGFTPANLSAEARAHIDRVLSVYAKFSGQQLEDMTHKEDPWVEARSGFEPWERCTNNIDEQTMKRYYASRLNR